jgi:integrase
MVSRLKRRGRIIYARVPCPSGGTRRVSTRCTDRHAAEVVACRLEREAVDPTYATARAATTQRIVDDYYASRERLGRSEGSKHHVRTKLGNLLRLLPIRAEDITHAAVERYIDARLSEWAVVPQRGPRGQPLSEGRHVRRTTIKKELRVLKPALKLARKNGLFHRDPDEVIPEFPDDYEPRTRALSPWEVAGMAMVLPPHRAAVVAFMVATSAEDSAVWRARKEDVAADFSYVRVHGKKRKTRERVAPVPLPHMRTLLAWAVEHAGGARDGRLFSAWPNIRRDLAAACKKLGIAHVSPNDCRRTYSKWLRTAGIELNLIAPGMGHKDDRMLQRVYAQLEPDELVALVEKRVGKERGPSSGSANGAPPVAPSAPPSPAAAQPLAHMRYSGAPDRSFPVGIAAVLCGTENPRVGGSIPPLRTMISRDFAGIARPSEWS